MRTFKGLYYIISYSLLAIQIGFISIWLYNKIIYQGVLYYGNTDKPSDISQNYFDILKFQLYATFALLILWSLLTPLAILSNKRSMAEERIHLSKGIAGFIVAVVLLVIDPFGMFKWFAQ